MTYNDDVWEIEVRRLGSVEATAYIDIVVKNKVSNTLFKDSWFVTTIDNNKDVFAISIKHKLEQRYNNEA